MTVTGPDRLGWLDSLTSQAIKGLRPGDSSETLQLDVNGRLEYAMRVVDDGVTTWLLVDDGEAEGLIAWLNRMRFMMRVEVDDRSADFVTVGTLGEPVLDVAAPNGVPLVWRDSWATVAPGGHQYAAVAEHPGAQFTYSERLLDAAALAAASALPVAGTLALEALRIAAWRPRLATEGDEKTIPHELDWLRSALHLSKGCYRGQETVAKVHNLGHPPRRLVMLHLDGSDGVLPAAGDPIALLDSAAPDATIGTVTSAARHYELGPIALAVIKRSVDHDAPLVVTSDGIRISAAQEIIVPRTAGAAVDVPRLPRLGAVRR
ncbi:MAG: putative aminomethyltransferase [Microbacteriaceae bacterium]|nr:putative aminomethyltransferase [Microbacteriaceae bacterium]